MLDSDNLTITISDELARRLTTEASALGMTPQERALQVLDGAIAPADNLSEGSMAEGFAALTSYLGRVPAISSVSQSSPDEPLWWIKLRIDITSPIAWQVVQELGYVLNNLSVEEPLPTTFRPVSPPPYMNGGPAEFLSWLIEATLPFLDASIVAEFLEGRLPRPVEDLSQWKLDDDENSDGSAE